MEIDKLVDLNRLRTAPLLSNTQVKNLSEELKTNGIPILDNKQYDCLNDLVEIIMEFTDLKKLYHQTITA